MSDRFGQRIMIGALLCGLSLTAQTAQADDLPERGAGSGNDQARIIERLKGYRQEMKDFHAEQGQNTVEVQEPMGALGTKPVADPAEPTDLPRLDPDMTTSAALLLVAVGILALGRRSRQNLRQT